MRFVSSITLAIAATLAIPALFAATGEISQPFSITISAPQSTIKVGDEIRIHVVLTNISDKTLAFRSSPSKELAEMFYKVMVHDKNEKEAPETERGHRARQHEYGGSMGIFWLKPGETWEEDAILSELFDFSSPGEYAVQLSRHIADDSGKELVKSNKITITVTE